LFFFQPVAFAADIALSGDCQQMLEQFEATISLVRVKKA
jgi:hypothetical protein